jgi:hypothetical protein
VGVEYLVCAPLSSAHWHGAAPNRFTTHSPLSTSTTTATPRPWARARRPRETLATVAEQEPAGAATTCLLRTRHRCLPALNRLARRCCSCVDKQKLSRALDGQPGSSAGAFSCWSSRNLAPGLSKPGGLDSDVRARARTKRYGSLIVRSLSKPLVSPHNSRNASPRSRLSVVVRLQAFCGPMTDPSTACHAEGRGFESLQPLSKRPTFAGLFCSDSRLVRLRRAGPKPDPGLTRGTRPIRSACLQGNLIDRTADLLRGADAERHGFDRAGSPRSPC